MDKLAIGGERPKLEILDEWIKEYELSYQEVAYIGDDLPDIPILKVVGFSGCPFIVKRVDNINSPVAKFIDSLPE